MNIYRLLEVCWLILTLLAVSVGIFKSLTDSALSGLWFFLVAFFTSIFWMLRRSQRAKNESETDK
jgi:predicted branched-subunit amino acid permease